MQSGNNRPWAVRIGDPGEAGVRAINDLSDFGSWRVFADIIAQVGKFAPGGTAPGDFIVDAEERTWLSFTLDRQTGAVVLRKREHPAE